MRYSIFRPIFPNMFVSLLLVVCLSSGQLQNAKAIEIQEKREPSVLRVGPGDQFLLPSIAAKEAKDGDVILIDAKGSYDGDTAIWRANNLLIKGINGRPHLKTQNLIDNGKAIWITVGNHIAIENIEFSGAKVRDRNGAAIRAEGAGLNISRCYIHDNENGILTSANPDSDIRIENSEFAFNGDGTGQTHNIYIGKVRSFSFIASLSHHAKVGHTLKSRALENQILYSRLMDGYDGNASYLIDLPNGGYSIVMGNVIQQSPKAENWTLLAYGLEGLSNPINELYVAYNTFVNNRPSGQFIKMKEGAKGLAMNNLFAGKGNIIDGKIELTNNLHQVRAGFFVEPELLDFHIKNDSEIVDQAKLFRLPSGRELIPEYQISDMAIVKRLQNGRAHDLGAYEYGVR